jgi:peptide subunit release factor RF-3
VNKLDREGRDRFDLIDEIEQALALDVTRPPGRSACMREFRCGGNQKATE